MMMSDIHTPALEVRNLVKHYPFRRGWFGGGGQGAVHAVDGVSFTLPRGETLALVGESGCGKSTIAKLILRLIEPTAGSVLLEGTDLAGLDDGALRQARQRIQMVFQDPFASLNPRLNAAAIVGEPLVNYGIGDAAARAAQVDTLFDRVGLARYQRDRYPHQFSGGQRQRLGIARALALNPAVVVADEPVSALDVSVRARVLDLMLELQEQMGLAYLFISHDMAVIEKMSHDVAVMKGGRIIEIGKRQQIFEDPCENYTRLLMAAVPVADPLHYRRG